MRLARCSAKYQLASRYEEIRVSSKTRTRTASLSLTNLMVHSTPSGVRPLNVSFIGSKVPFGSDIR